MSITKLSMISATAVFMGTTAYAGCGISSGNVSILGNEFAAIQAVAEGAKQCAGDGVTVESNLNKDYRELQVAALTANPAQYTAVTTTNAAIVPLLGDDLIRPLDDLIAKHGQNLSKNQMITVDGKVMAVAFMANAQHLFVRKDVLEAAGVDVPTTYEEVIAAGKAIKDAGLMEHPFATTSKTGWNLGEEFVNMYLGFGGEFFKPGTAEPNINNEAGIAALNTLKSLTELSNPDYLTFDSNAVQASWEAGEIAMAHLWGSRGTGLLDNEGSTEEIVSNTLLVSSPTVGGGDIPASTLWWDGFAIASNISDEDAEASFLAMLNGISPAVVKANNDAAVWLVEGYEPSPASAGVFATAAGKTKPYPMIPFMGLMHTALGAELTEFLQGSESAEQALADTEAAYISAAKEKGFLN
ncbi:ABC transporter substrate-binding protein [Phaeobacter italicus]|uniref:ABC transporter substrate-binding protein n=1 Tax=Phaeobacter italicus TaxID=481446 RepID=UPI000186F8B2|nr:extracellular solute-binding protein [Phaeobacter italicus]EEB72247.1 extracellular solute-binding protein, family 1 [Ruegeria sp. R11]MEC8014741.1 extracellular solute-binding protein [Pseudomonadota bacterium]MBY5976338.1 extracellular solute-binding protein [Phaeobacter italicus]MEC8574216.1 extracellular solute-binding protein [Pseudomonadota bacterium]MEE2816695.1 extracellular solute-binding protein [Pseudomonadota bacterium]